MRLNAERVQRAHTLVSVSDVLTLVQGEEVRIIEVLSLPERRASPAKARLHFQELDRMGETRIAAP